MAFRIASNLKRELQVLAKQKRKDLLVMGERYRVSFRTCMKVGWSHWAQGEALRTLCIEGVGVPALGCSSAGLAVLLVAFAG